MSAYVVAAAVVLPRYEEVRAVEPKGRRLLVVCRLRDDDAIRVKHGAGRRHPRTVNVVAAAALVLPHHKEVHAVKGKGGRLLVVCRLRDDKARGSSTVPPGVTRAP